MHFKANCLAACLPIFFIQCKSPLDVYGLLHSISFCFVSTFFFFFFFSGSGLVMQTHTHTHTNTLLLPCHSRLVSPTVSAAPFSNNAVLLLFSVVFLSVVCLTLFCFPFCLLFLLSFFLFILLSSSVSPKLAAPDDDDNDNKQQLQ